MLRFYITRTWFFAASRLVLPLEDCVKNVMASVWSVTPTCVPAPWCAYVTSVTMALTRGAVWSAEAREFQMPIIVRSAPSRRRIEMAAQRLSIWGALRQISSMNAKNTASRKGDWWVASFSPPPPSCCSCQKKYLLLPAEREWRPAHHLNCLWRPWHLSTSSSSHPDVAGMENRFFTGHSGRLYPKNWID